MLKFDFRKETQLVVKFVTDKYYQAMHIKGAILLN